MASVPEARMHAREAENRAIALAFLASVALHLLLLAAWPTLRDPSKRAEFSPGPIIARLLAPKLAAPVEVAPPRPEAPSTPKPEAAPVLGREDAPKATADSARTLKPLRAATAKPEPSLSKKLEPPSEPKRDRPGKPVHQATSVKPIVSPAGAAPPASEPAAPHAARAAALPAIAPTLPESAPRSVLAATAPGAAPKPRAQAPQAPDAGTLAQYRLAVIEVAKGYKRYPRVALDNNWQGRVEVRMVIGADGAISALGVRASTGHEVLDLQALDMIRQAKPQTPIPAALRGREFAIEIPVIFNLREPGA